MISGKVKVANIITYLVVLFPSFFGFLGLNVGQMFYLVVVLGTIIGFFVIFPKYFSITVTKKIYTIVICFLLLVIEYSISSLINFKRNSYGMGDMIEILRPIIYLVSFLFSIYIVKGAITIDSCYTTFDIFENCVFYFSFFELLKFIPKTYVLFRFYNVFPYGSINYIRMSGMTGFAYNYAWILNICIFWNIFKTKRINLKFVYFSFLVLLTGSRTGILSLLVTYFFIFVFYKDTRRILIFAVFFIIIIISVLYFANIEFVKTSVDYIIRLVLAFLGKGSDGSLSTRMNQNREAMQFFDSAPFFGIASNKSNNIVIENFYFHHIRNWGLVGLLLYLSLFFILILVTSPMYRKLVFIIIISGCIISFSSPVFDQVRNFNIFYLLIGTLILNPSYSIKKEKKTNFDKLLYFLLK